MIASDREAAAKGNAAVMFPDLHAYESMYWIPELETTWENYVTEQTQLNMLLFEGQAMIHRISPTPLFMVIPSNDVTVKTAAQLAAFDKAREPKEKLVIEGAGHFDIYTGDFFEQNIAAQIGWLRNTLV